MLKKSLKSEILLVLVSGICMLYSSLLLASESSGDQIVVFFENFSNHGASSAKQPKEWVNPTWTNPKSRDGKWWAMGTGWYASSKIPAIARQKLMGNMMMSRNWVTTTDFKISPDPVKNSFKLELKFLNYSYHKGIMFVKVVDSKGNGYGFSIALAGASAKKFNYKTGIFKWVANKRKILSVADAANATFPIKKSGGILSLEFTRDKDGQMLLKVDGKEIVKATDTLYNSFTTLGLMVDYESRFTIDDIKLSTDAENLED